jgi:lipopolysaccharide exporter
VFAAAVAAGEVLRHAGYLGLMRRLVGLTMTQVWGSYAPAAFASAGVALAMGVIRRALDTEAPTLVTFAAEVAAGAFALSLCIRFCPLPAICRELRMRLTAAGVLGGVGGLRWRLAPLVLGQPDPRS